MTIKASLVVQLPYQVNKIFNLDNPVNGRDNHMHVFYLLKEQFRNHNIDLSTQDINNVANADIVIYNDMPKSFPTRKVGQKIFLLAMESVAVAPDNFNLSLYAYFDKVFTWADDFINEQNIIKINYSFLINPKTYIDFDHKNKFVCMVSGNKFSNHNNEVYSERIKIIEFLEKNMPSDFDLFGTGWDKAYKNIKLYNFVKWFQQNRILRKTWSMFQRFFLLIGLKSLLFKEYICYSGMLSPKIPTLTLYKFNICYENVDGIQGYITEKIFDCFFSGCVPVYFGASNITQYIPKATFVDRRDFKNNEELFLYLKSIKEPEYTNYQKNMLKFLQEGSNQFSSEFNASKIVHHVIS